VERGKCNDRGLMFLTGPVCFLCNARQWRDKRPYARCQGQRRCPESTGWMKSWKICRRSSHILPFINMGTVLAYTWTEWGK